MGKIFCLIGKSSTGKDTIAKIILNSMNLKTITLYTTRPIREGEINGREYYFVSNEELNKLESTGKVIEKRVYHTIHGDWSYATVDSNINLESDNYLILNTLEGYKRLVKYYGRDIVVPIYIWVDLNTRLDRAFLREEQEEKPKYKELCRRFIADESDFCEANLLDLEILEEDRYLNDDLDICVKNIKNKITSDINKQENVRKIGVFQ